MNGGCLMILTPAAAGGAVLVFAISGTGKSALAEGYPDVVVDGDVFLYSAVAVAFPSLPERARLRAWRAFCQTRPWEMDGPELERWASVRRAIFEPLVRVMESGERKLVVTSLPDVPWKVSAYYGVERGRYLEHLRLAGRIVDNEQSEAMNNRLEGYSPLARLAPGTFLSQRDEIKQYVAGLQAG